MMVTLCLQGGFAGVGPSIQYDPRVFAHAPTIAIKIAVACILNH